MKPAHLLLTAGLALLAACDDDPARQDPTPDAAGDQGLAPDEGPQVLPDAGPADAAPDAAPDAFIPPPILDAPLAWVYLDDPTTNDGMLSQVPLHRVTDPEGKLTSESVQVFNCLNEEGGLVAHPDLGGFTLEVSLCHEVQTVRPDADGNYLSIRPPVDALGTPAPGDPNDPFAEVMMYHHVNRVHDYFKEQHRFTDLDFPLPAIVNLQFKIDPPLPIPGFMPGPDGWYPFPNAAFFPRESWNELASSLGLPGATPTRSSSGRRGTTSPTTRGVIYHEYTHAVVGRSRLQVPAGVDRRPRRVAPGHERGPRRLLRRHPGQRVGHRRLRHRRAGPRSGPRPGRRPDLPGRSVRRGPRRRPHHRLDPLGGPRGAGAPGHRSHRVPGPGAVHRGTTHQIAAELILAEAEAEGPDVAAQVREIFVRFGFIDCERAIPWARFRAQGSRDGLPHRVEGRSTVGIPASARGSRPTSSSTWTCLRGRPA
ncbi:MAG: hypothetical protein R3F43_00710 [bacterium]